MRLALAQLNPTVGDVAGNTRLVLHAIDQARSDGAEVLVAGELGLIGYPPRDLLFRAGVVEACEQAVGEIARHAGDLLVIVGHPRRCPGGTRPLRNSVSVCRAGKVVAVYDKRLLPGYDVFDEDRYFDPGDQPCVVEAAGRRLGLLICEDLWRAEDVRTERSYPIDPVQETAALGCDVLLSLHANPFVLGKWQRHLEQLRAAATRHKVPIVAVQQVGANDDLIFDGRSVVVAADGSIAVMLPGWVEQVQTIEVPMGAHGLESVGFAVEPMSELYHALVLGVNDYCRKTSNDKVIIGLSGGIDSAVTACIAAAALGPDNVLGVMMPSRYSSAASLEDAMELAANLALPRCQTVPIESTHLAVQDALAAPLRGRTGDVTDENLQARLRGVLLMAFANATGALVLAPGNKSELASGYCTIYGDMCGALAVLGDVVKTRVYALARWINAHHVDCGFAQPPIPQRSLTRPPSAELRPNQLDQDTLPPYETLDLIVERYIELEQSVPQIIDETDIEAQLVRETVSMIDRAQYKRDQAALILKVTARTFGRGRPMPIAMRWQELGGRSQESGVTGQRSGVRGEKSGITG
ncbi:MAG: NAD+ synthase [Planctomycetota bacterium]|nr:NAD+ synthase [Planctomycetota bacterium]